MAPCNILDKLVITIGVVLGIQSYLCLSGCHANCEEYDLLSCQSSSGLKAFLRLNRIDIMETYAYKANWLLEFEWTQLTRYCRYFGNYRTCLEGDVIANCSADVKLAIIGLNEAIHFLCIESFDAFIDHHQECFKSLTEPGITECISVDTENMVNAKDAKQKCSISKERQSCGLDIVTAACGEETSNWFRIFKTRMNKPVLQYYGCNRVVAVETKETEKRLSTHSLIEIIVGGVIFVSIAVALPIGIICLMRLKRRTHTATKRVNRRAPMPMYDVIGCEKGVNLHPQNTTQNAIQNLTLEEENALLDSRTLTPLFF